MIYTSARWADEAETMVIGTDANGNTERRSIDNPHEWRRPEEFLTGFLAGGGMVEPYEAPPVIVTPPQPSLFATVAVCVADGAITVIEQASQVGSIFYEDGWLMATFPGNTADFMIFAQPEFPCRVEQIKYDGGFELVFSDANGDPVEPGRVDIQIIKVR